MVAKDKYQKLKIEDVVLIEQENVKRMMSPIGEFVKIYNSKDGVSTVAKRKIIFGYLTRPVQKDYPLEVTTAGDSILTVILIADVDMEG